MGKLYTFISKDKTNTKVKTKDLDLYLKDGWVIGNWNQDELNKKSGAGVKNFYADLEKSGKLEEYNSNKSIKISKTLKDFWDNADSNYREERELKKNTSRKNWSVEERKLYHQKMSKSAKQNRKTISEEEYRVRAAKAHKTRKANGTCNTSKDEEISYTNLTQVFGSENVLRQYIDKERYPFACDFYIKSLDLFIECNYSWTHGNHIFNPNDDNDITLLESWKKRGLKSDYYKNAIHTWTIRDINKYNTAMKNKINYKIFYNIEEFHIWINEEINK